MYTVTIILLGYILLGEYHQLEYLRNTKSKNKKNIETKVVYKKPEHLENSEILLAFMNWQYTHCSQFDQY